MAGGPPSRTWTGGAQREGDAGCGAATAPSRPGLMTEPDSFTQSCAHFRNVEVGKLKGKASTCSLFGTAGTTPFCSPLTLLRAYIFRKEESLLNCVDHLPKIECSRFSLGPLEHLMLPPDSWHGRSARLTLTSGTEDDGEGLTLV